MKKLFVLFYCLFCGLPLFASGIASNTNSAPCTNMTLETYSGNSNLAADWQPNTINISWYNENEKLTVQQSAQSCVYDGTLSVPATQPTRTGYTFAGWTAIPATRIEYLQSNGTQWIDTGLPGNNDNYYLVLDFMIIDPVWPNSSEEWACVLGNYDRNLGEDGSTWRIVIYSNLTGYINTNTRSGSGQVGYPFILNQRYSVKLKRFEAKINNEPFVFDAPSGITNNNNIVLFNMTDTDGSNAIAAKIYSFVAYENNVLVRDMVPVLDSNGIACMYDKVTRQFFYNAGSGTFTAGPEIN